MEKTAREISELINGIIIGNEDVIIYGVSGLSEVREGEITFIENTKLLPSAEESKASVVIAPGEIKESKKTLICVKNPRLSFAKVLQIYKPSQRFPQGIHPTSIIAESAAIGKNVSIGAYTIIGENTSIGENTVIFPYVYIGDNVTIGKDTLLYPQVVIYDRITIGNRIIIHSGAVIGSDGFGFVKTDEGYYKIPQLGTVVIEDDVEIGANAAIDRATTGETKVMRGTKIDNLVQVGHNVVIGEDVVIAGQAGISGSCKIGKGVMIAGQAGIVDHVNIGDNSILGAQAGIIGDVPSDSFYSGYPARPHKNQLKIHALTNRLPELAKKLKELGEEITKLKQKIK